MSARKLSKDSHLEQTATPLAPYRVYEIFAGLWQRARVGPTGVERRWFGRGRVFLSGTIRGKKDGWEGNQALSNGEC